MVRGEREEQVLHALGAGVGLVARWAPACIPQPVPGKVQLSSARLGMGSYDVSGSGHKTPFPTLNDREERGFARL
jgi:hypothetical protein